MLPHGDTGRIVNSFVSARHPDALEWQRKFRMSLARPILPYLAELCGTVYLVASNNRRRAYSHAVRLPDYRRIFNYPCRRISNTCYPSKALPRLKRLVRESPLFMLNGGTRLPWDI